jgi:hypothetical protein
VVVEVIERIVEIYALGDFSPAESAGRCAPGDSECHRSHNAVVEDAIRADENGTADDAVEGTLSGFERAVL